MQFFPLYNQLSLIIPFLSLGDKENMIEFSESNI